MPKAQRFVIDRFEDGEWAVLETSERRTIVIPRSWVPHTAREGDGLVVSEGVDSPEGVRTLRVEIDVAARDIHLEKARRLKEGLPEGPKGDFTL